MVTVLDLSHYNGDVDFKSISIDSVFIKATEGLAVMDAKFQENWDGCEKASIPRGAYHFFRPNSDPFNQANNFLRTVSPSLKYEGELPPVLDLEVFGIYTPNLQVESALNWLTCVEKMTGRIPVIYTNRNIMKQLDNSPLLKDFPLWLAEYDVSEPNVPGPWDKWTFWQYTESGKCAGISGQVDLSQFNGTKEQMLQL